MQVFKDEHRFKCIVAGRRWGKSRLAAVNLLVEGLKNENEFGQSLSDKMVFYVAPTFDQAKRILWSLLKDLGRDVIKNTYENTATITLINGRRIELKGTDKPDSLRGVGLSYVVLDEYADMKPEVWEQILRPALADVKGHAMFIGTPKGKNHFFELYREAGKLPEWGTWEFKSRDNPTLDPDEIEAARQTLSSSAYRQEFEASFSGSGVGLLKEEWIKIDSDEPHEGQFYVAVDPAGYEEVAEQAKSKLKRLDETAIAMVKVHQGGWWVKEVRHGRWNIRETALQIIKAARDCDAVATGIEKGALKNAIMPYLDDTKRRLNIYPRIEPLTHGGRKKTERISWALQGRFEHGKITLNEGNWNKAFIDQYLDFPNPMAHDDLIDALAYVDQIATTNYEFYNWDDNYEPLDDIAGY